MLRTRKDTGGSRTSEISCRSRRSRSTTSTLSSTGRRIGELTRLNWRARLLPRSRGKLEEIRAERLAQLRQITSIESIGGSNEGWFFALDAVSGKPLWRFQTGGMMAAAPISFQMNGKQHVAMVSNHAVVVFAR